MKEYVLGNLIQLFDTAHKCHVHAANSVNLINHLWKELDWTLSWEKDKESKATFCFC